MSVAILRHTGAPFVADNGCLGSMGTMVKGLREAPDKQHLESKRFSTAAASAALNSTSASSPSRFRSLALLSDATHTAGDSTWYAAARRREHCLHLWFPYANSDFVKFSAGSSPHVLHFHVVTARRVVLLFRGAMGTSVGWCVEVIEMGTHGPYIPAPREPLDI